MFQVIRFASARACSKWSARPSLGKFVIFAWVSLSAGLAMSVQASAQSITTFTDAASFNAALPTSDFSTTTEDFSSITTNTLMSTVAPGDAFSGFNVVATGSSTFGASGFCPMLSDPQASTPTSCIGFNSQAPDVPGIVGGFSLTGSISFTFPNRIFAFSFDFIDWNDISQRSSFTVFLSDGTSLPVVGPTNPSNAPPQFFGFIVDEETREAGVHITSLVWAGLDAPGELVGFWNIQTRFLTPQLETTKSFAAATLNPDQTVDVPVTISVLNSGQLNVSNLQLTDNLADASNFSVAYTPSTAAVTTGGVIVAPAVSATDDGSVLTAVAPTLNGGFDGGPSNSTLFNGTTGALGPGDQIEVTFTVRIDPFATGAPANFFNLATATALDPFDNVISDESGLAGGGAGTPTPFPIPPSNPVIALVKTATLNDGVVAPSGRADAGDTITYTYVVNNTGNVNLNDIAVSETGGTFTGTGTLPTPTFDSGGADLDGDADQADLGVGTGPITFTSTYVLTQADINSEGVTNQAVATGTPRVGATVSDNSDESATGSGDNDPTELNYDAEPTLSLTKVANDDTLREVGDVIVYTYTATNTGNVPITNVTVNDVHNGSGPAPTPGDEALLNDVAPLGDSIDAVPPNGSWDTLGPGDSITFTGNYTVTQTDVDTRQ